MNEQRTPEQEMEFQKNVNRVALNLRVLLDIGLFPGAHSRGLEECKGYVEAIIQDSDKKMKPQIVPPPDPIPAA